MFDSDENFVEFGTALEPLEEEEVPKKKPVNIADQIVVDEKGRRRFHGAFTGGFSAGYFNTVGSKEGWEPSEFKSTRTDRFSKKNQNIQDFMDEEDTGSFGIAPQVLRTTGDFDKKESRKRTKGIQSDGPIPGEPVLDMLIQPVRNTVGMRILKQMGWRPGQGVGPRINKGGPMKPRRKKGDLKDNQNTFLEDATIENIDLTSKVYGCSLPPGGMSKGSEDDEASTDSEFDFEHMLSPKDLESPLCNPKENTYGLGYTGLDRNALATSHGHIDLFGSDLKFRVDKKKLSIRGEAFGVGAFEDDDEEVYSREDISQYDFTLETPDERKSRLANEKIMKKAKTAPGGALPGFTRAKQPQARGEYFAPPTLPKNFEPIHSKRKSRFERGPDTKEDEGENTRRQGLDRHKLTVEERQVLLGEAKERISSGKLDTETSGFSGNSKADQLQRAQEKSERLKKFAEVLQAFSSNKVNQVDSLGRPAFKPFMKNPEKQDRYEKYMTLVAAGYKECLPDLQPLDMTEWQREREKMEFERASALYKPISEVMSSRFISAQSHDISHVVPIKEVVLAKDPTQDPKVAAKMNLFGKLTHQVLEWHPDRLLCKRLNVPHPYPESKIVGVRNVSSAPTSKSAPSGVQDTAPVAELVAVPVIKKSLFDNLDFSKPPPGLLPAAQVDTTEPPPPGTEDDLPSSSSAMQIDIQHSEQESIEPVPNSNTKPPIDLFKEIFADSSDSEHSEDEDEVHKPRSNPISKTIDNINIVDVRKSNYTKRFDQTSAENTRNTTTRNETSSQIKGIHDQKDDASNFKVEPYLKSSNSNSHRKSAEIKNKAIEYSAEGEHDDDEEDMYGPKPPSSYGTTITTISKIKFSSNPLKKTSLTVTTPSKFEQDEVEWVERGKDSLPISYKESSKKSSHHHRKTKKSKEKHKSKHKSSKSKKEKRHKSTSKHSSKSKSRSRKDSDSEDDDADSSSPTSSPVQIHQSLSNKALLSKLKELTRSN